MKLTFSVFFLVGFGGMLSITTSWDASGGDFINVGDVNVVGNVMTGSLPLVNRTTRALCGGR